MSLLYKYRDLSNLPFALDIFANGRLYAAPFTALNDPMEGQYRYRRGALEHHEREAIYGEKAIARILSLSRTPINLLMWSYYAAAHTGMVVGVEIQQDIDVETRPVQYVQSLSISGYHPDVGIDILTRKLDLWGHEEEVRVLKYVPPGTDRRKGAFINVDVREVYFGYNSNAALTELVEKIARQFCPGVYVRTLEKSELKAGELNPDEA